ncbi:MAG TPA: DUF5667 domain-containing protein [Candidatus Saccharimonadales bacterium]|nr:DUF5667 domain-containing protein [Candidatus Saccharimonadales bacterium]
MKIKLFLTAVVLVSLFTTAQAVSVFAIDADATSMDDVSPVPAISPIITMENKQIQYDLPYPGLLPDNPLYSLKVLRDKIVEFFISDPAKKADYELLQADKRINASIYLSNNKPVHEDSISATVSKAFNYLEQAVSQTQVAAKQKVDMQSFIQHMDTASQKYHSVILQLETKASPSLKKDLEGDQKRLDSIRKSIVKMEK